jgi:hypothetical protein
MSASSRGVFIRAAPEPERSTFFTGQQLQHPEGFFVAVLEAFGGDHLGDDEAGAAFRGEYPEGGVGYAGHRGQREVVLKPYGPYGERAEEFMGHGFIA